MRPGPLALFALMAACRPPIDLGDDEEPYIEETSVEGIIFKGPLVTGSVITVQAMDASLQPVGEPVTGAVSLDSGRYSLTLPMTGFARIDAEGALFDEAAGARVETPARMSGYAVVGDTLQLNLLGDLSRERVERLAADGMEASDAILTAESELVDALALGGTRPQSPGGALDVYQDSEDAAWLLGASSLVSIVGREDRAGLMDQIRSDLADDGSLEQALATRMDEGESLVDPDLVLFQLENYLEEAGVSEVLPTLDEALDSDGDGIANDVDICPYVFDPDQVEAAGGWGVACDDRLSTMVVSGGFGCGLRVTDASLVCWDLFAPVPGGNPPLPDAHPTAPYGPWGDAPGLSGSFDFIDISPGVVCGATSDVTCWVEGVPDLLTIDVAATMLSVSAGLICTLDEAAALSCVDHAGAEVISEAGPWFDMETVGEGNVCAILDSTLLIQCFDAPGAAPVANIPALPQRDVAGTDIGVGTAASISAGASALLGEPPVSVFGAGLLVAPSTPPADTDDLFVGENILCTSFQCFMRQEDCPQVPFDAWGPSLTNGPVAASDCISCGLYPDGFGWCEPTAEYR